MQDKYKTKAQLLEELNDLRQKVVQLEARHNSQAAGGVEKLVESQHLYQSTLDLLPQSIIRKDKELRFTFGNRVFLESLGMSLDDMVGKTNEDLYPKELAQKYTGDDRQVLQTGQSIDLIERHKAPASDESIYVRVIKTPVRDAKGEIDGLQLVFWDVTERIKTEQALTKEQTLLRTLIDNIPDLIYVKDVAGKFLLVNQAHAHYMGATTPDELVKKSDFDFYPEELAQQFRADEQQIVGAGRPLVDHEEVNLDQKSGRRSWTLTTKVPFKDDQGNILGLVGVSRDITERKQYQDALARRVTELETVGQVGTAASTILDPNQLLQVVVNLTKDRFNLYHTHIYLLNDMGDTLNLAAGAGDVGEKMVAQEWSIPLDQERSLVARAARTGKGVIVDNVREEPDWLPNPLLPNTWSELAVPMMVADRVLGVLDVQSDEIARFTQEDVHIQTTLALQVAVALENARLFEQGRNTLAETELQAWRLALMNEIGASLSQSADIDEVFRIVALKTGEIVEGDRVSVALVTPQSDKFEIMGLSGTQGAVPMGAVLPLKGTSVGRAVREMEVVINSETRDSRYIDVTQMYKAGMRSSLIAPLIASGQVLGTLNVASTKPNAYDVSDKNLMGQIASLLASTIESRQLFDQMQDALAEQQKSSYLLQERVKELNCLNEIGREITETPLLSEFLPWVAARIPPAMQQPGLCSVAINYDDRFYGVKEAVEMPSRIVNALRASGKVVGRITIAYSEKRDFLDEESALLGGVANRISGYIESRRLFKQIENRAERERLVNAISQKIQGTTTVDGALQTAIHELGQAFQAHRTQVKLGVAEDSNGDKLDTGEEIGT